METIEIEQVELGVLLSFFLSLLGWHTLPSHASAEACFRGVQDRAFFFQKIARLMGRLG